MNKAILVVWFCVYNNLVLVGLQTLVGPTTIICIYRNKLYDLGFAVAIV